MTGSLLMRLIDVVLIILFGFIGISDIQNKTQLKLPGQKDSDPNPEQTPPENVFVQIKIHQDIREEGEFEIVIGEDEPVNVFDLEGLKLELRNIHNALSRMNKNMIVIIDPTEDATMQRMVDVFDLCEEENYVKSIDFRLDEDEQEN